MKEVLLIQTKIYSYLFLKKLKQSRKCINKKNIYSNCFISKINTNENDCIKKIKLI